MHVKGEKNVLADVISNPKDDPLLYMFSSRKAQQRVGGIENAPPNIRGDLP